MKTVLVILSFVFIIVFASCDTPRYAYSPTAHNVPIFTKQGDSKIAAYYSTNGASSYSDDNGNEYDKATAHGADVQGAIAVTNNIALQGSYYIRSEGSTSNSNYSNFDNSTIKYKRNMFEFGAGYFMAIDKKEHMLFQLYAGAGLGKATIKEKGTDFNQNYYTRFYNTNLTKFYLEPSLTFRTPKDIFAATVATRASIIKFGKIRTDYTNDEKLSLNLDSLDRYPVIFFEPSFVGSFGFPKAPGFRVELQAGFSVLYQESFLDYRPFNFSLGLVFDIGKLIRGQKRIKIIHLKNCLIDQDKDYITVP
ncbi:MAG: hypothetical protein QM737_11340 [Ferruginibacter sp.]